MFTIFMTVIHVLACLLLIATILFQVGKGHGLSGASFGDAGVQSVFGTKTSDFLTKVTMGTAILFVLTCLTLDVMQARKSRSLFGPNTKQSEIDVNKLKEMIEQIQKEAAAKENLATSGEDTAVENLAEQADKAKTSLSEMVDTATKTLPVLATDKVAEVTKDVEVKIGELKETVKDAVAS